MALIYSCLLQSVNFNLSPHKLPSNSFLTYYLMIRILYLHGLESEQGGAKVGYLSANHYVYAPAAYTTSEA